MVLLVLKTFLNRKAHITTNMVSMIILAELAKLGQSVSKRTIGFLGSIVGVTAPFQEDINNTSNVFTEFGISDSILSVIINKPDLIKRGGIEHKKNK
jgi:hypothetical protein